MRYRVVGRADDLRVVVRNEGRAWYAMVTIRAGGTLVHATQLFEESTHAVAAAEAYLRERYAPAEIVRASSDDRQGGAGPSS